ncbi:MAG: tetraacyldisaccharide 4'-kinase [Ignavibacteriales bacterium]|nr:tetraacyldisaccharide 4'-kinase [Ignavibacteriales bacterium]
MKDSAPDWPQIFQKKRFGPLTVLLALISVLYGLGVRLRLCAYRIGILKKEALPGFVLSVGNLTAGGTGKTPAVAMLARWALSRRYKVSILSRGYGRKNKKKLLEVSDGKSLRVGPEEAGDEPYLLGKMIKGVTIVISKNRHLAGLFAGKKYASDFFILDDGFQHIKLERDFNVVLIDADLPFGNGHLLPWGPLREPLSSLDRADAFILTRYKGDASKSKASGFLRTNSPACPVFYADHLPDRVVFPDSDRFYEPELLQGKRIVAFSGIAQPGLFKDTLKSLGAEIIAFKAFRDHYWFSRNEIDSLVHLKEKYAAEYLLTTEKDWVRISSLEPNNFDIGYLSIKFKFTSGEEDFFKVIQDAIKTKGLSFDTNL